MRPGLYDGSSARHYWRTFSNPDGMSFEDWCEANERSLRSRRSKVNNDLWLGIDASEDPLDVPRVEPTWRFRLAIGAVVVVCLVFVFLLYVLCCGGRA